MAIDVRQLTLPTRTARAVLTTLSWILIPKSLRSSGIHSPLIWRPGLVFGLQNLGGSALLSAGAPSERMRADGSAAWAPSWPALPMGKWSRAAFMILIPSSAVSAADQDEAELETAFGVLLQRVVRRRATGCVFRTLELPVFGSVIGAMCFSAKACAFCSAAFSFSSRYAGLNFCRSISSFVVSMK